MSTLETLLTITVENQHLFNLWLKKNSLREVHKCAHLKICTRIFKAIFVKFQSGNIQIPK